ncbi:MAG: response regulator, partial [Gammaproteobacteria bacterium]|nr:response regulator [Gammaproteobacteria bacterium]
DKANLFESFTQANNDIYKHNSGTGLGLAISKQLIELMHGSIDVRDNQPQGSIFWIQLPIKEIQAPEETLKTIKPLSFEKLHGLDVLVADDNEINRKLISSLLNLYGIHIIEAENGQQALEHASTRNFDLILMDIRMPELSGIEATEKIRSAVNGINNKTPIIALTAHALPHEQKMFMDAGMNACLTKPVLDYQLYELFDHWVENN